ncbi:hypothetical protein PENTCL1PPCAC_9728 [Pristionchus entomophagus]|uniref:Uncharacterized protein n=1 Tax=Pristionchus entomophagus TaxID=358040 RepID=A0AAV5T3Y2_9BILA|nr:hypothetical protein PENTCL1PPCAC_9728 [Pristionchus entomophagus]
MTDYPTASPFEGELESTTRTSDLNEIHALALSDEWEKRKEALLAMQHALEKELEGLFNRYLTLQSLVIAETDITLIPDLQNRLGDYENALKAAKEWAHATLPEKEHEADNLLHDLKWKMDNTDGLKKDLNGDIICAHEILHLNEGLERTIAELERANEAGDIEPFNRRISDLIPDLDHLSKLLIDRNQERVSNPDINPDDLKRRLDAIESDVANTKQALELQKRISTSFGETLQGRNVDEIKYDPSDEFIIESSSVDLSHVSPVDSTRHEVGDDEFIIDSRPVLDQPETLPVFADSTNRLRHPEEGAEFIIDSSPADRSPETPLGRLEEMHPKSPIHEESRDVAFEDLYGYAPDSTPATTTAASAVPDRPSADRSSLVIEEVETLSDVDDVMHRSTARVEEEDVKTSNMVVEPAVTKHEYSISSDYTGVPDDDEFIIASRSSQPPIHESSKPVDVIVVPSAPERSESPVYTEPKKDDVHTTTVTIIIETTTIADMPLPDAPEPIYDVVERDTLPTVPAHRPDPDLERLQTIEPEMPAAEKRRDEEMERYQATGVDLSREPHKPSEMALSSFTETIERSKKTQPKSSQLTDEPVVVDHDRIERSQTPDELAYLDRPPFQIPREEPRTQVISDIQPSDWLEREALAADSARRSLSPLTSTTVTERTERYMRKSPTPDRSPRHEPAVDYGRPRDVTELSVKRLRERFVPIHPVREIERVDREEITQLSPERLAERMHDRTERTPPLDWSLSISARHPPPRTPSPELISPRRHISPEYRRFEQSATSPRGDSTSPIWHDDSARISRRDSTDRAAASRLGVASDLRRRQLSPHSWTTIRESTEISYVRRTHHTSTTSRRSPPDSSRFQKWDTAASSIAKTTRGDFYSLSPTPEFSAVTPRHPIQPYRGQSEDTRRTSRRRVPPTSPSTSCDRPANCGIHRGDGPSWTAMGIHHPVYPPRQALYVKRRDSHMNGNGTERPTNGIDRPATNGYSSRNGSMSARAAVPTSHTTYTHQSATFPRGSTRHRTTLTWSSGCVFRVPRPEYRATPVDEEWRRTEHSSL